MSLRRLWVLVSNLPPDSATNETLAGGKEVTAWTLSVELLAQANERIAVLDHHFLQANSKTRVPEPEMITRPQGVTHGARTELRPSGR